MAIGIYAWKWMEGKLVYHLRKMARIYWAASIETAPYL